MGKPARFLTSMCKDVSAASAMALRTELTEWMARKFLRVSPGVPSKDGDFWIPLGGGTKTFYPVK